MQNENITPVIGENQKLKKCKCPYCGASMKAHWHRLSKGLANTLVSFRKKAIVSNNKVHIKNDIELSKTAFNNFQKLRYHGLVTKWVNPETKEHEAGYWLLTRRGNLFCKNQLEVPAKVQTFRNKIYQKSLEKVFLSDILSQENMPYWDSIEKFDFEFADIYDIEEIKFDSNGQGLMPF